jgi:hypothetical protein
MVSDSSTYTNGLGYDTLPFLSTNVLAVQHSGSWYLGDSCKPALAKFDKVRKGSLKSLDKHPFEEI